ncbi:competence pheromone ComX [Paenibacillus kobensis]|uniref:competence pheromone ComX n=1 Tax=Paenibacillus kobensis TaxID=59841 RepID=UPI000FDA49FA|nr:competence pheromone ComX [Paenibacillus kobensis]
MLREAIAQMKQNPEMMRQLIRENKALEAVSQAQQQAMYDVIKESQPAKVQVRGLWWNTN